MIAETEIDSLARICASAALSSLANRAPCDPDGILATMGNDPNGAVVELEIYSDLAVTIALGPEKVPGLLPTKIHAKKAATALRDHTGLRVGACGLEIGGVEVAASNGSEGRLNLGADSGAVQRTVDRTALRDLWIGMRSDVKHNHDKDDAYRPGLDAMRCTPTYVYTTNGHTLQRRETQIFAGFKEFFSIPAIVLDAVSALAPGAFAHDQLDVTFHGLNKLTCGPLTCTWRERVPFPDCEPLFSGERGEHGLTFQLALAHKSITDALRWLRPCKDKGVILAANGDGLQLYQGIEESDEDETRSTLTINNQVKPLALGGMVLRTGKGTWGVNAAYLRAALLNCDTQCTLKLSGEREVMLLLGPASQHLIMPMSLGIHPPKDLAKTAAKGRQK